MSFVNLRIFYGHCRKLKEILLPQNIQLYPENTNRLSVEKSLKFLSKFQSDMTKPP